MVGYVPDAKHLLADLRGFKPTYLLGVPRVFEKVYNAASQKAGAGIRGHIFANAVDHFVSWSKMMSEHKHPGPMMRIKHSFYMSTVASSFRSPLARTCGISRVAERRSIRTSCISSMASMTSPSFRGTA
mgnify:CR=1 FL=1